MLEDSLFESTNIFVAKVHQGHFFTRLEGKKGENVSFSLIVVISYTCMSIAPIFFNSNITIIEKNLPITF
jgi:hypothetical protein